MVAAVNVRLPRALLQYWSGPASVDVEGDDLAAALGSVDERAPGLVSRILDDQGRIRRHVAIFHNGELVTTRDPRAVALRGGDKIHIVPNVSGG